MITRAAIVRCLTCNAPCPPGLAAEFSKAMAEKCPPTKTMTLGEAIASGTIMMMVGYMLQHHTTGESQLHNIVIEHYLMVCKHHGEANCACPPAALVTEGEYYNGQRAH